MVSTAFRILLENSQDPLEIILAIDNTVYGSQETTKAPRTISSVFIALVSMALWPIVLEPGVFTEFFLISLTWYLATKKILQ